MYYPSKIFFWGFIFENLFIYFCLNSKFGHKNPVFDTLPSAAEEAWNIGERPERKKERKKEEHFHCFTLETNFLRKQTTSLYAHTHTHTHRYKYILLFTKSPEKLSLFYYFFPELSGKKEAEKIGGYFAAPNQFEFCLGISMARPNQEAVETFISITGATEAVAEQKLLVYLFLILFFCFFFVCLVFASWVRLWIWGFWWAVFDWIFDRNAFGIAGDWFDGVYSGA